MFAPRRTQQGKIHAEFLRQRLPNFRKRRVRRKRFELFIQRIRLTDLTCAATPYAAAQGASAVYWLRDTLGSGIHPVISETGALTLPADTEVPGIRPLALLDLTAYVFTAGDGTEENPYR